MLHLIFEGWRFISNPVHLFMHYSFKPFFQLLQWHAFYNNLFLIHFLFVIIVFIFIAAKAEELRRDIQVLSQTFERVIDRKDAIIKSLAKDIEEAEEQYQIALRSHLQNIDSLIDFQAKRICSLEEEFKNELQVLEKEFEMERQLMLCRHDQEMRELSDITLAMEIRFNERESEALQEFQSLMDEIKNKVRDIHMYICELVIICNIGC